MANLITSVKDFIMGCNGELISTKDGLFICQQNDPLTILVILLLVMAIVFYIKNRTK